MWMSLVLFPLEFVFELEYGLRYSARIGMSLYIFLKIYQNRLFTIFLFSDVSRILLLAMSEIPVSQTLVS